MMGQTARKQDVMPTIVADEQMAEKLRVEGPREVRTADGRLLGRFTPARMSCPVVGLTDEELDERLNDPNAKWYTADEVMARLRELG
jgi:hypothetical protein